MRFVARRIDTGEILHDELPVDEGKVRFALSGPCSITGKFSPELPDVARAGLIPWGTWLDLVIDGEVQCSTILQPGSLEDETLSFTATGPAGYPHGMPYRGMYMPKEKIDPATAVRELWRHLQSFQDGDLGVVVTGSTPVRIGTPPKKDDSDAGWYALREFDNVDCGEEINKLAAAHKFDYQERAEWNADRSAVNHFIDILYPQPARRPENLRIAEGENLRAQPAIPATDTYASEVLGFGAGDGAKKIRAVSSQVIPGRLRRVAVITDDTVTKPADMRALTDIELRRRSYDISFTQVVFDAFHPACPLGAFRCGDLIPIITTLPYLGTVPLLHQIAAYELDTTTDDITADVVRTDG